MILFIFVVISIMYRTKREEEDELIDDLKEGIRYVKHSSLQSSAYYMADAEDRGLKLEHYVDKVKKDLQRN